MPASRRRPVLAGLVLVVAVTALVAGVAALRGKGAQHPQRPPEWTEAVRVACDAEAARLARVFLPLTSDPDADVEAVSEELLRRAPRAMMESIARLRKIPVPAEQRPAWAGYLNDNERAVRLLAAAQRSGDESSAQFTELRALDERLARFAGPYELSRCSVGALPSGY